MRRLKPAPCVLDFPTDEGDSLIESILSAARSLRESGKPGLDRALRELRGSPFGGMVPPGPSDSNPVSFAEACFEGLAGWPDEASRRKALILSFGALLLADPEEPEEALGRELRAFVASGCPAGRILRKAASLGPRKLDFLQGMGRRRRIYGEADPILAAGRLGELRLSHRHPYCRGLEEFLASDEIEAATPLCLRGILAFGYFGDRRLELARDCLRRSRKAGERIGFGLFTLAMIRLRGGAASGRADARAAMRLLGEAAKAGCAAANEWRVRLLLAGSGAELPRMPVSDEEWNEYEESAGFVLNNDQLDAVFALTHAGKERPRIGPARRGKDGRRAARAARWAIEGDPGWGSETLDLAVDVLWRRGRFREALPWIERGLLLRAPWALEDLIGLALDEDDGADPESGNARREAREAMVRGELLGPSLVLAAGDGYFRGPIRRIAAMLESGAGLPRDARLAGALREKADAAEREAEARARPAALSDEEIDRLLVGIPARRDRED